MWPDGMDETDKVAQVADATWSNSRCSLDSSEWADELNKMQDANGKGQMRWSLKMKWKSGVRDGVVEIDKGFVPALKPCPDELCVPVHGFDKGI